MKRRVAVTTAVVLGALVAIVVAWRVARRAPVRQADVESERATAALAAHEPAAALTHAMRALQLAPGHPDAAWTRALALRELGLGRSAAVAFDGVARRGERGRSSDALRQAMALRSADHAHNRTRIEADFAGREIEKSGGTAAPALEAAYPALFAHYRAKRANDPAHDPWAALADEERVARATLNAGDAAGAEKRALAGVEHARAAGVDPADLVRRFFLVAADAARAQHRDALADAYVDEARLFMPDE